MSNLTRSQKALLQRALEQASAVRLNLPAYLYAQADSCGKLVNEFLSRGFVARWKWFLFGQ